MHVFVTGASGWIGTAVVDDLLASGHTVTGLARSDAAAEKLAAKGVDVRRGDLDDIDGLRAGADAAEAVVHLANKHDFTDPAVSNAAERAAVETIAETLQGSGRRLLLASGVATGDADRPGTEDDVLPWHGPDSPRGGSENLALEYVDRGVHAISLRFPPTVHGTRDHGFIAVIAQIARDHGVSGYPGEGHNLWSAVHVADAARMTTLALEKAPAGMRPQAVAEEGVPTREIAEALGQVLGLPTESVPTEQVGEHFGWMGMFFDSQRAASSAHTREVLGWTPTGPGLVEDILGGAYTQA